MEIGKGLLGAALIVCLLAGIGIGWVIKPAPPTLTPTVTLTVIGPWSGTEEEKFLPVLGNFTEETGIEIDYRTMRGEDLVTVLPAQFGAEMAPGDLIFMWGWFISQYKEHVVDVTDSIDETKILAGALDPVKVGGKTYGGCWTGKAKPGFWYKKSFFADQGLTKPTTYDEFKALLADLKEITTLDAAIASGDSVGWPLSDVAEYFILAFGGPDMFKGLIDGTISWTSTEVRAVFEKLVELLEAGYFSEPGAWDTRVTEFDQEKYGVYFMGSWITGMVSDASDLGLISIKPDIEGLVFNPDYFFIPKYSEYQDEAKQLLQYLMGAEAQEIHASQGGAIATNVDVPLDAYIPVDREVAEAMEGKEALVDLDDTIGGEFQATFWSQLQLLWVEPTALDEVLAAIQEKAP